MTKVSELRGRLGSGRRPLTRAEFSHIVGADPRSVARWEGGCPSSGETGPTGGSKAVVMALQIFTERHPD